MNKGKGSVGKVLGKTDNKLQRVLSQGSHPGNTSFLQQGIVVTWVKCCLLGKYIRDSVLKVFIGGLCRYHVLFTVFVQIV